MFACRLNIVTEMLYIVRTWRFHMYPNFQTDVIASDLYVQQYSANDAQYSAEEGTVSRMQTCLAFGFLVLLLPFRVLHGIPYEKHSPFHNWFVLFHSAESMNLPAVQASCRHERAQCVQMFIIQICMCSACHSDDSQHFSLPK